MWRHPALWWLCGLISENYQEQAITSRSRSLQDTLTFDDAKRLVHEAPCSPLNASLEGELVHLTCPVSYAQPLGQDDPMLSGTPAEERRGLYLEAYMEVFQWDEFEISKTVGKRSERDWLYFREWMTRTPPSNSTFWGNGRKCKVKNGNRDCYQWIPSQVEPWWNASGYRLGWATVETAQNVTVGDYEIPEYVLLEQGQPKVVQPACSASATSGERGLLEDFPCAPGGTAHLLGSVVAWQQLDSNGTMIDYLTRSYQVYPVETISILAVQRGNSFVPWPENSASPLLYRFVPGSYSATQMIDAAKSAAVQTPKARSWRIAGIAALVLQLLLLH